ncbi:hypothetical protein FKM82_005867 [Ascaphus truei]
MEPEEILTLNLSEVPVAETPCTSPRPAPLPPAVAAAATAPLLFRESEGSHQLKRPHSRLFKHTIRRMISENRRHHRESMAMARNIVVAINSQTNQLLCLRQQEVDILRPSSMLITHSVSISGVSSSSTVPASSPVH